MRENRTYGSEGGEGNSFPTPIQGAAAFTPADAVRSRTPERIRRPAS